MYVVHTRTQFSPLLVLFFFLFCLPPPSSSSSSSLSISHFNHTIVDVVVGAILLSNSALYKSYTTPSMHRVVGGSFVCSCWRSVEMNQCVLYVCVRCLSSSSSWASALCLFSVKYSRFLVSKNIIVLFLLLGFSSLNCFFFV